MTFAILTQTGTPTTALQASFATNVMTVVSLTGSLVNAPNATAVGTFVIGASVAAGTFITGQLTGTVGSTGTYSLSTSPGTVVQEACTTLFGWQAPAGITTLTNTEAIGGGVGGLGTSNSGMGGGAYSAQPSVSVTAGNWYAYQVATGSAGVIDGSSAAGGDTWFNGATLGASSVGAKGGAGGGSAAGGVGSSGVGTTKVSGGAGGGALGLSSGGGGAGGPNSSIGSAGGWSQQYHVLRAEAAAVVVAQPVATVLARRAAMAATTSQARAAAQVA